MELIGSLFLVLALALVVALYIGRPLLLRSGQAGAAQATTAEQEHEHERSALLAERDRVLNALQELDFDYALGKVPEEDYPQQRGALLKTGAEVLRRLDEMNTEGASAVSEAAEDRIEAAVAARRADSSGRKTGSPADVLGESQAIAEPAVVATNGNGKGKDELEDIIASRKRVRKESAAGFCPHCGKPVQKSDRFCSKCGTTLSQ